MGLLERLAPHLPYVRRYARALTRRPESRRRLCPRLTSKPSQRAKPRFRRSLRPVSPSIACFTPIWGGTGAMLEPNGSEGW